MKENNISATTLCINPYLRVVRISKNEVMVKHGSRSPFTKTWSDRARTGMVGRILQHYDSGPTCLDVLIEAGSLAEEERTEASSFVEDLIDEGVLIRPEQDVINAYLGAIHGIESDLTNKRVGLLGSGQLGSRIARQLVQMGLNKLFILDDSVVTNVATTSRFVDLPVAGMKEGASMAAILAEQLKPHDLEILSYQSPESISDEDIEQLFEESDFVIAAFDELLTARLHVVNRVALEAEKPWASIYVDGSEGVVGPIYVPGDTACYNEFEQQAFAVSGFLKKEVLTYYDHLAGKTAASVGVSLPPFIDIVSGQLTSGVLAYLASGRSFLVGRAIRNDFERMAVDYEDIHRIPRCPACAPFRPFRHVFL